MTESTNPDLATEFFARLRKECVPRIERATVPFYAVQDDKLHRDRTGVLYKVAGHHFILTASHYLRPIVENNIPLYIDRTDNSTLPIPLANAVFHSTEEEGRDVGVIKLPDDVAEQLLPTKEFVTHSEVRLAEKNADSLYVLFGYPERWSGVATESSVVSHPLIYVCRPYEGQCDPDAFFDPNVHVVLELHQDAFNVLEEATVQLPRLHGVSGCGIWRVADWSAAGLQGWRPEQTCLVALQHRWYPKREYIQGTWIGFALALVQHNYPEVSAAMKLIYPSG